MKNAFVVMLALFCAFPLRLPAQEPLDIAHGCNFAAADTLSEVYAYAPSAEAKQIVERVMRMNVLPQNFEVRSADCSNALATVIGRQRYILYSTAFLENFKKESSTQWAAFCVLAHEIGHHLSNHDLQETAPKVRKGWELEADKFAGGVLFRLGATLEEAQAGINTFSSDAANSQT
ncbi:MAG: M48 family metalloprotease, partial [Saprospiraceae bacterium]